jgi:DNA-binding NtrC family response regulator
MTDVLLCSQNPLLVKNIYGMLSDSGYGVEIAEHPAFAVQRVMAKSFACVIFDSEPFGLPVEEAVAIMHRIAPAVPVLVMEGAVDAGQVLGAIVAHSPEDVKKTIDEVARLSV